MRKILIIEILFENSFQLADWILAANIYSKYLRLNLSAKPHLTFYKPHHFTVLDPITGNFNAFSCVEFLTNLSERSARTGQFAIRTTRVRINAVLLYYVYIYCLVCCRNSGSVKQPYYTLRQKLHIVYNKHRRIHRKQCVGLTEWRNVHMYYRTASVNRGGSEAQLHSFLTTTLDSSQYYRQV